MKMTGHKTEAVYRRYAIIDSAMLQEAAVKLAVLQLRKRRAQVQPKLRSFRLKTDGYPLQKLFDFNTLPRARVAEWQTRWT